MSVQFSSVTSL